MPSRDEPTASSASSPSVPNPQPPQGVVRSAEPLGRPSRASGVSGERDGSLIDLTNSLEFDRESGPASRTSPPRPPSSHGDTTSGAAGVDRSNSAEQASLSFLEALVRAESASRQEENAALARLLAFISTRPPPAIDPSERRALLSASSLAEIADALQDQQPMPSSSNDVAALRVELSTAESVNTNLSRRLDSLAVENAELWDKLDVAERERALWEREAKKLSPFMTSLRKSLAATEASLKTAREVQSKKVAAAFAHAEAFRAQVRERDAEIARLVNAISARDAEYAALQGVAAKHFEQLTESARLLSSGDSQPLRHAQATIADQRRVILNQKSIIARQGFLPMHDPHMAAAAGAGLDVPGLNPAELQLNARLCRVLAARFPEVIGIPAGETRSVELIIHPRQDGSSATPPTSVVSSSSSFLGVSTRSSTPVCPTNSSVAPAASTQSTRSSRLRRSKSVDQLHRARVDTLTPAERLRRLANPKSPTAAEPRRKEHVPPPQPYACPLPGEPGYEEAVALFDEVTQELGLPSVSSSNSADVRVGDLGEAGSANDSTIDFDAPDLAQPVVPLVPYSGSPSLSPAVGSDAGTPSAGQVAPPATAAASPRGSLGCCFGFGNTPAIILFDSQVIVVASRAWSRPIQFDFVDRTGSSSKYSVEFYSACRAFWL
ncbi:uncharacterized protein IUM83_11295 [Phytophthora cinnamomi]|uniref:uncharacterized protein n=1 Tax=Phytophthora cinnamomi TaxID=4785 RepID=UPI0035597E7C|nr:hypothetical protein IUM83_11295 [Phytophthora cinnamomi]